MMQRTAEFSPCRIWMYNLTRTWRSKKPFAVFIGLNPSTATEIEDDPTIRRCMGFAHSWGFGGVVMLNIFAFRSTDPKGLLAAADPIGPGNDAALMKWVKDERTGIIIAAWGIHGAFRGRGKAVMEKLAGSVPVFCLGKTKAGCPRHPLYLAKSIDPVFFC